jgi:hypothetical protein
MSSALSGCVNKANPSVSYVTLVSDTEDFTLASTITAASAVGGLSWTGTNLLPTLLPANDTAARIEMPIKLVRPAGGGLVLTAAVTPVMMTITVHTPGLSPETKDHEVEVIIIQD